MSLSNEEKIARFDAQQAKQREYHKKRNALTAKLHAYLNSEAGQNDAELQAFLES